MALGAGATCITDVVIPGLKQQQPQQQLTPAQQQQQQQPPAHAQQQQQSTLSHQQQPVPTRQHQQQQEQQSKKTQEHEPLQAQQHGHHPPQGLMQVSSSQANLASKPPAYVLFVVDSTWCYAREMFDALSWLRHPRGPAVQVTLPGNASVGCAAAGSNLTISCSGSRSSTNDHGGTISSSSGSDVLLDSAGSSSCKARLGDCAAGSPRCSLACSQSQHQQLIDQHHSNKASRMQQIQQSCRNSCTGTIAEAAAYGAEPGEPQDEAQHQMHWHSMQADQQQHQQQQTVQKQPQQLSASQQPQQPVPGVQVVPVRIADPGPVACDCSDLNASSSSMGNSSSCSVDSTVTTCPSVSGVSCRLRTEPHESCCSTYEAVARVSIVFLDDVFGLCSLLFGSVLLC